VPLIARAIWHKVDDELGAGHNRSRTPGDCRASSFHEGGSAPNPWRLHLPVNGHCCAHPAQMVPTHRGVEHLVCGRSMEQYDAAPGTSMEQLAHNCAENILWPDAPSTHLTRSTYFLSSTPQPRP